MTLFWFMVFIFMLLIEIITINLVSVWFAIGALVSCIMSLFINSVNIQIFSFILVSVVILLVTKPFVKKVKKREFEPTNLDRIIGRIGVVSSDITPLDHGEVKVDGKRWTAVSKHELVVGTKVKILKIDGVKVIVEKVEED